jgi:hypothetical protein
VLVSFGAITSVLWLSLQYLTNPDVAFWLDAAFLGRGDRQRSTSTPQTLKEIQSNLTQAKLGAGQPIILKQDFALRSGLTTAAELALPVLVKDETTDCSAPCQRIQQLRIYRSLRLPLPIRMFQRDAYFRLTEVIPLQGPSAAELLAMDQNPLVSAGSDQPLPLTQSEVYNPAPQPGLWLRLIGLRTQGSGVSTYGQVFYFNPIRERLDLMANWVSPPGEVPQWQQVTGDALPELVVNQTVGIEPQYTVYQLYMTDGAASQLRPILLTEPAFEDNAYTDALTLARGGLWTPAQQMLTQVKQNSPKRWSAAAQAQLDYIQLHANVTQAHANQPSASTVQRILGYLVNGSWQPALAVLRSDRAARSEVREMLLSDSGRLASRIDTALKITPADSSIIAWGAMLRLIRNSETQAIAWAQQQANGNAATLDSVKTLIKFLNQTEPEPLNKPVLKSSPLPSTEISEVR